MKTILLKMSHVWNLSKSYLLSLVPENLFFSYLGFPSQPFTNHRNAGGRGGHFFNSHFHFHLLHRQLDISRAITAESSPLLVQLISWTQNGNLWSPDASR